MFHLSVTPGLSEQHSFCYKMHFHLNIGLRNLFIHLILRIQRWICFCRYTLGSHSPEWELWFNCSVMSDSLWPRGLQHTRLSSPSLSLRICLNSYLLSQWCISSSVRYLKKIITYKTVQESKCFKRGQEDVSSFSNSLLPHLYPSFHPIYFDQTKQI